MFNVHLSAKEQVTSQLVISAQRHASMLFPKPQKCDNFTITFLEKFYSKSKKENYFVCLIDMLVVNK